MTVSTIAARSGIATVLQLVDEGPERSTFARLIGSNPLDPAGRAAYRCALGGIEVGDQLDGLAAGASGWHVFHSVPVGDQADIEHVVIGPAGVFVVAAATHPDGVVIADGRIFTSSDERHPHIRNMESEIGRVERMLTAATGSPVEVSGVVAVAGARQLEVREAHRDVAVVEAGSLADWFVARSDTLAPDRVAALASAAALASTWNTDVASLEDPAPLRERFDRLHSEVERASTLQQLWGTALTVAGGGAFIIVTFFVLNATLGTAAS